MSPGASPTKALVITVEVVKTGAGPAAAKVDGGAVVVKERIDDDSGKIVVGSATV